MRILGFSKKWEKLQNDTFTTFRFPRKDTDWAVGEVVQAVYKHRSPQREPLGTAQIIGKEIKLTSPSTDVTEAEAKADGFENLDAMRIWMENTHGIRAYSPLNKLTLKWVKRVGSNG